MIASIEYGVAGARLRDRAAKRQSKEHKKKNLIGIRHECIAPKWERVVPPTTAIHVRRWRTV